MQCNRRYKDTRILTPLEVGWGRRALPGAARALDLAGGGDVGVGLGGRDVGLGRRHEPLGDGKSKAQRVVRWSFPFSIAEL